MGAGVRHDVPRAPTPADLVGFTPFILTDGVRKFMFTNVDATGKTVQGF